MSRNDDRSSTSSISLSAYLEACVLELAPYKSLKGLWVAYYAGVVGAVCVSSSDVDLVWHDLCTRRQLTVDYDKLGAWTAPFKQGSMPVIQRSATVVTCRLLSICPANLCGKLSIRSFPMTHMLSMLSVRLLLNLDCYASHEPITYHCNPNWLDPRDFTLC
jgi:hypothetical protein